MTDEKKPKRTAIYIEEHDELAEWIEQFKETTKEMSGIVLTSKQAHDAFLKVAFEALAKTEDDGKPLGTGEL